MSNLEFTRRWLQAVRETPIERVHLECIRQGWGKPLQGQSINSTPLCLHGRKFTDGLGVHADSEVAVTLDAPARGFRAWVGVDDNESSRRPILQGLEPCALVFSVEGDGHSLWQSPPLTVRDLPVEADVPLDGVRSFTLKVVVVEGRSADRHMDFAHGDWAEASVELADGSKLAVGGSLAAQRLPLGPVFSFLYGGRPSSELLPIWPREDVTETVSDGVTRHRLTYRDPQTRLAVILELKEFADFPAVEWVVRFRNDGSADTPLMEDIQALDVSWTATEDTWLHRSLGSHSGLDDFAYGKDELRAGTDFPMTAGGGRSSNNWLPFFNLQTGGEGVVAAIGWTGQWAARFSREEANVSLRAGMERTHLVLHPGEEIRTPSAALIFWEGRPIDGSNLLRRFLISRHTARPDGQLLQGPLSSGNWGGQKTEVHLDTIRKIQAERTPYDVYWIDAGWYGTPESYSPVEFTGKWAGQVGNWFPNPIAHPAGMRPIGDAAEAAGLRFLLWFEPERAIWGTQITQEHPDWFLGERTAGKNVLLNLGNKDAREWVTDYISQCVTDWKLGFYRQDFNFEPLPYWTAADAPDRQGMAEIGHIQGLYAFWDELLRRHPGLMIDNCASGGRRLDLETTGRSIPLWRSDFQCQPGCDPLAAQCHTFGLAHWLPLSGTSAHHDGENTYDFRCALGAALGFGSAPGAWRDKMMADFCRARPLFYGDFYPLTGYSTGRDVWCVYQLHRAELGEGMVMAFRREECPFTRGEFALSGLEPQGEYRLEDADTGETWTLTGRSLAEDGLGLSLDEPRQSRLVFYKAAPQA